MAAEDLENKLTWASRLGKLGNRTYLFNHHAGWYPWCSDGTLRRRKSLKVTFSTVLEFADALTERVAGAEPK